MSRVGRNVLANLAGQGWSVLVSIAAIPLYIKFLGIEAYGLIGFYVMLQGILQVLDLGLSPTMNRELARYSTMPEKAGEARNFVRTLEVGYWILGILIGLLIIVGAPVIATYWLKVSTIPPADVQYAVRIMGGLVTLQWPLSFYGSGLMGLQRQVLLNSVIISMTTLSSVGAVLVLWLISPSIIVFFTWQVAVSAFQLSIVTMLLWRSLPHSESRQKFDIELLSKTWRFTAGMGGIALSAVVLTYADKMILSKILSMEMFGYYMLASVVGRGLYVLITPVFNAMFPRFSALVASGDIGELKALYHRGSQLMAVLVLPVAAVVALFSYDLLMLWIGNAETARNVAPIASLLVIGTALNGLMNLPYALQLAYGSTRIALSITTLLILTLVPAIVFATIYYGAVGGAAMWVVLNTIYMLLGILLTHRHFLKGEAWRWLGEDVGLPLLATVLVAGLGRWVVTSPMVPIWALPGLSTILICSFAAAALISTQTRSWVLAKLVKAKSSYA